MRLPPYRITHALRQDVRRELEEMLDHGIIEHSSSDWASPLVIVRKKDSSLRLCVDYRRLNSHSKADAYPMPWVDDLIDLVAGSPYITTLNLTKGYWQVPVAKERCLRHHSGCTSSPGCPLACRVHPPHSRGWLTNY